MVKGEALWVVLMVVTGGALWRDSWGVPPRRPDLKRPERTDPSLLLTERMVLEGGCQS